MSDTPLPSDRASLEYEITELEKEYHGRFLTDPVFHARSRMIGNFLEQLDSVHQSGDTERAGFLVAALTDKTQRELLRNVWEQGMAAAKLAALGIKPARNPYEEES